MRNQLAALHPGLTVFNAHSMQEDLDRAAEYVLRASVVNRFQEKAAFSAATNIYSMATPPVPAAEAVRKADVIEQTSRMRPDGTLDWMPPAGRWVVLRIGYSLTGHGMGQPAPGNWRGHPNMG